MDLEARAEVLLGHRRALDVPARPAAPPRGFPPRVLAGLVRLPERKVARILLERVRLLLLHLVEPLTRETAVVGEPRDAVVDVTFDLVGEAALEQPLDQDDLLGDRVRGGRLDVGPSQAEAVGVLEVPARRVGRELGTVPGRGVVDLVVYVGDVHDDLRLVATVLEPPLQPQRQHADCEGIADVDAPVDRRAAPIDPDRAGRRGQLDERARVGVVDAHGS